MRDGQDFGGFYVAHYGDTVAMAYTYTADLGDAQDIAQEAFVRAWRRWTHVSRYDNPVAWVRHVAVNLARSRWRSLRLSAAHLVRQQVSDQVPGAEPDHVAVVAALRKLPRRQCEAVVMHHMMDLPVSEVAEHFDVPEGGMVQTRMYPPAIGELDGDGRAEAVLGVYCLPIRDEPRAERLMVVKRADDGTLHAVAITSYRPKLTRSLRIDSGTIIASARTFPDVDGEAETVERWNLTTQHTLVRLG